MDSARVFFSFSPVELIFFFLLPLCLLQYLGQAEGSCKGRVSVSLIPRVPIFRVVDRLKSQRSVAGKQAGSAAQGRNTRDRTVVGPSVSCAALVRVLCRFLCVRQQQQQQQQQSAVPDGPKCGKAGESAMRLVN